MDLLIIGTHRPPLAERLLLGSVADRVIQKARVPVLVVPAIATAWRASHPVDVLIPLDGSPPAEGAVPVGYGLAHLLEGDLHLLVVPPRAVHVSQPAPAELWHPDLHAS